MKNFHFDAYTRRAQMVPVSIVVLPLIIAGAICLPQFALVDRLAGVGTILVGIAMLTAQIGRDLGKRKEPDLWRMWGGAPTTQLLRHRSTESNPVLRDRYHRQLRRLIPDLKLPTPKSEERDMMSADHVYDACVRYLITQTRDRERFPLLFSENVNYGFRRNLWGMKSFGLIFSVIAIAGCVFYFWFRWEHLRAFSVESIIGIVLNLAFLLFWLFWVTPSWVRIPADAYSQRLLESCEYIGAKNKES